MKNKGSVLFWTDVVMGSAGLALVLTGVVLEWVLPPGAGRNRGGQREFLDLSRHEWGSWHFYIALGFVAFVLIHLVLHWNWIRTSIARRLPFGANVKTDK